MNNALLPVVLQKCDTYDRSAIAALVDVMAGHLMLSDSLRGNIVLLKPNFISSSGPSLACTNGEFIAGVASWFLDQGARVLIGDSPAFGSSEKVCRTFGITEALKGMNVKLVRFKSSVSRRLAGGVTVTIAREALECDLFVGLPKIKAHNQMFVTMAVKNMFGIIKGVNKAMLHMVHGDTHEQFAGIILDLVNLLPSQLHLADGIEAMHRSGPLEGRSLALNCMAAARCPIALDTALLDLLELNQTKSPLWRVASMRELAGSEIHNLRYPLRSPQYFHGSGFIAPDSLNGIRFNLFRFLRGLVKRVTLRVFD
jgi:uncharacterized protein (DUF362 family)